MAADESRASTAPADAAFAAAAKAYVNTPGSWAEGVAAAISALFEFLATSSDAVASCLLVDGPAAHSARSEHDDRLLKRFADLLEPGFDIASESPPPVVAEAIGGSILELVRLHALEGRLTELPRATGDAIVVALVPFVGARAANALARSTSPAD